MSAHQRVDARSLFVWLIALLSYVIAVMNRGSFSALGPTAQDYFQVDATVLGTFAMIQVGIYAALQIPAGIFIHRFGPTTVIIFGAVLMTAGQTTLAFADEVWEVFVARILVGIGDAGTFVSVLLILRSWFPERQQPVWIQITSQFGQLGQILAVLPLSILVVSFGWVTGFLAMASVTFLVGVAVFLFVRDFPGQARFSKRNSVKQKAGSPPTQPVRLEPAHTRRPSLFAEIWSQLKGIPELWRISGVRLAFWVHFTLPVTTGSFLVLWGYPFLVGGVGVTSAEARSLITLCVVSGAAFGLITGPVMIRFQAQREKILFGVIGLTMASWALVLLTPGTPEGWMLVLLMIVLGMGFPTSMTGFDILRANTPARLISVGTGLVNTGGFIATIIALFIIGFALDLQGAGTPQTFSLPAFKVAMGAQGIIWIFAVCAMTRANLQTPKAPKISTF